MIKATRHNLQFYVDRLKSGDRFGFVRYGNGEWDTILQTRQRTGSGSHRLDIPRMQAQMLQSITLAHNDPNYWPALRNTSMTGRVERWLKDNTPEHIHWHDCTTFYKASKKGRLFPFVDTLRNHDLPLVVIGPDWLRLLRRHIRPIHLFIEVRSKNCYPDIKRVITQASAVKGPAIYSISAGPPGKILAWMLWSRVHKDSYVLDLGSLWDVYCGRRDRSYQKGMRQDTIRKNLHGK